MTMREKLISESILILQLQSVNITTIHTGEKHHTNIIVLKIALICLNFIMAPLKELSYS
jgi:hypothetical protein